ncbi:unannotated protein [freshwater metagenome]|uniref:Unannotated protein n=1 Tax=freshwater metagenome TaxID=449393 RepID=A0A6J7KTG7_9ZZZZ
MVPSVVRCSRVRPATADTAMPTPERVSNSSATGRVPATAMTSRGSPATARVRVTGPVRRGRIDRPTAPADPISSPIPAAPISRPAVASPSPSTSLAKETPRISSEPVTTKEAKTSISSESSERSWATTRTPVRTPSWGTSSAPRTCGIPNRRHSIAAVAAIRAVARAVAARPLASISSPAMAGPRKTPTPSRKPEAALVRTSSRGVGTSCGSAA